MSEVYERNLHRASWREYHYCTYIQSLPDHPVPRVATFSRKWLVGLQMPTKSLWPIFYQKPNAMMKRRIELCLKWAFSLPFSNTNDHLLSNNIFLSTLVSSHPTPFLNGKTVGIVWPWSMKGVVSIQGPFGPFWKATPCCHSLTGVVLAPTSLISLITSRETAAPSSHRGLQFECPFTLKVLHKVLSLLS